MLDTATSVRELTFGDAIKEAIAQEMRRDPRVILMGEDVAEAGTTFKVLTGLVDEFGRNRIMTRRSLRPASRVSASAQRWRGCGRLSTSCSAIS